MDDALLLERLVNRNNSKAISAQMRTATRRASTFSFMQNCYNECDFSPDPLGHGNLGWEVREQYLKLLGRVFQRAAQVRQQTNTPLKPTIYINLKNSAWNSIGIDTSDSCGDNFPMEYSVKLRQETGEVALFLSELIGVDCLCVGHIRNCLWVFSPLHGYPARFSNTEPLDGALLLKRLKRSPFSPQAIAAGLRMAAKSVETEKLDLHRDAWYDCCHYHLDWNGHSNLAWKIRKRYLTLMGQLYIRLAQQLKNWSKPYQLFIHLDIIHAENDAVFLHSPNTNEENFPITMQDLDWHLPGVLNLLAEQMPIPNLQVGFNRRDHSLCLYSPEIGISLQP